VLRRAGKKLRMGFDISVLQTTGVMHPKSETADIGAI